MTYLETMMRLLKNEIADDQHQHRLDLARVECAHNQELQLELDRRQASFNAARERNRDEIVNIALLN
jgi:hypothetical protein